MEDHMFLIYDLIYDNVSMGN